MVNVSTILSLIVGFGGRMLSIPFKSWPTGQPSTLPWQEDKAERIDYGQAPLLKRSVRKRRTSLRVAEIGLTCRLPHQLCHSPQADWYVLCVEARVADCSILVMFPDTWKMAKWSLGYIGWILRGNAGSLIKCLEFRIMTGFLINGFKRARHQGCACHTGATKTKSAFSWGTFISTGAIRLNGGKA